MSLKLLCVARPADGHHERQISLLSKAGVEVHVIDRGIEFQQSLGRRILFLVLGKRVGSRLTEWLFYRRFWSIWKRTGAQVLHVHWVDRHLHSIIKCGIRPLAVTAYGTDLNSTRFGYDPADLESVKRGLRSVDLLIADSEDMFAIANDLAGKKLRSLLLPVGVDSSLFKPGYEAEANAWRDELGIEANARVILSPRVLRRNYRHAELLGAFARAVHERRIDDAYMMFKTYVGDPVYTDELCTTAKALKVWDRVRLVDEIPYERLPIFYAMGDLAVNFPQMDAFPVTFLEAGSCEIPILTNRLPAYSSNGMVEFLTFFDGEDEKTLSENIVRSLRDPQMRLKARGGRAHITAHLDEIAFVRKLLEAYEELLGQ